MEDAVFSQVNGNVLSCYTASISAYMQKKGILHGLALGTQLYLGVQINNHNPLQLSFCHYHTPLLGKQITHHLELSRNSTDDLEEAKAGIIHEWHKEGAVIVVGDAMNLPWLVSAGSKHAPHWYVIHEISPDYRQVRICDPFEFTDEKGNQRPYDGWLDLDALLQVSTVSPDPSYPFLSRDIWAFGFKENSGLIRTSGYQWLESVHTPRVFKPDIDQMVEMIERSVAFHTGERIRSDQSGAVWTTGVEAVKLLSKLADTYLQQDDFYSYTNDFWVIARTRRYFSQVLMAIGELMMYHEFIRIAEWCEQEVCEKWDTIPRIMRYNKTMLERGRPVRRLLIEILEELYKLEIELLELLKRQTNR